MASSATLRSGRTRRRNDPQGVRGRILDNAARMFQERGYHSTSVHDLIHVSRVSAGALHHHFPTKKTLALAVLADRVGPVVRAAWIDPVRQAATLGRGIAAAFADIIAGVRERGTVSGCPLNNLALELALTDVDLRDAIEGIFAEWRSALIERIGGTRGGARLDGRERLAAANFVISVYSGAMNLSKATQSSAPLADAAQLLAHWLREHQLAA
ncbi:MAG: TetR/AcrR family transcriptional regulator [Sinobacteraceae bacterium]|nr:TetR/AcrR family transcriptional regulator [Nevskiaceae bacterium]MBV9911289.1 TetR/AcrR family transcriptional regulator [Nevskiaceae bacterium]